MSTSDRQYHQLEARITKGDVDAVLARWAFGRKLVAERGAGERLPKGRAEAIAKASGIVDTHVHYLKEFSRRMQFAEQYKTETAVRQAFKALGSWSAICARGLLSREVIKAVSDPDHVGQPPQPSLPFVVEYHAIMGRIRSFLKDRGVPYQALFWTALERGVREELDAVELRARHEAERDPGLMKYVS